MIGAPKRRSKAADLWLDTAASAVFLADGWPFWTRFLQRLVTHLGVKQCDVSKVVYVSVPSYFAGSNSSASSVSSPVRSTTITRSARLVNNPSASL